MGIINRAFSSLLSWRSADTGTSNTGGDFFSQFSFGGGIKGFGAVNYKQSLKLSAVYNAVDMKSDALGMTPFGVFQKVDGGRESRPDHPVSWLLNQEPDGEHGWLVPFHWRKLISMSLELRGNCLFKIITQSSGTMYVKYIPWDDVYDVKKVKQDNGMDVIVYRVKGEVLLAHEVLHYKQLSLDGIVGLSVITYACLNLGLGLEIQEYSYMNFQNKGVRQGTIETDKAIPDGKAAIKAAWNTAMQEKSPDRIVVLDEGMKFNPITITPQEAQIIESSRFSIEDIARWFNVPLPKLKSLSQSTNNNIEQQSQDWLSDSIQPIVTAVEQTESRRLFTRAERLAGYYIKGNTNANLRSNIKDRGEFYSKMVQLGVYTRNEVRAKEELNRIDGLDEPLTPANTLTQSQIDEQQNDNGNE